MLLAVQKPVDSDTLLSIRTRLLGSGSEHLEPLIAYLQQFKYTDLFSLLLKALEYFRVQYSSGGDFEQQLGAARELYSGVLGTLWVWLRLLVLRANGYQLDAYL